VVGVVIVEEPAARLMIETAIDMTLTIGAARVPRDRGRMHATCAPSRAFRG
jgi:hypothetical protein